MSNPASMILTRDEVLWSTDHDSHLSLCKEHGLNRLTNRPDFVRVEIVPQALCPDRVDFTLPLDQWEYSIVRDTAFLTQDCWLPKWYEPMFDEARVRKALVDWAKHHIVRKGCIAKSLIVENKQTRILFGKAHAEVFNEGRVWCYENISSVVHDGIAICHDKSNVVAYNGTFICRDRSRGTLYDGTGWGADYSHLIVEGGKAECFDNCCVTWFGGNLKRNSSFNGKLKDCRRKGKIIDRGETCIA